MNYHDKIILELGSNKDMLGAHLGLLELELSSSVSIGDGDIDLLVKGQDYEGSMVQAIIEVKGHKGLTQHYLRKQLPKYVNKFPNAQQWIVTGDENQEVDITKFNFQRYN